MSVATINFSGRRAAGEPGRALPHRRGAIFVTALGVIIVLSGLVLVFAREMRTEAMSAKNRTSSIQASMVEQGAEQWVLAQIEAAAPGDAYTICRIPAQQLQVGDGYFWLLQPDMLHDNLPAYGIVDESSKVNINGPWVTSSMLQGLPNVTNEIGDSILDWRNAAGSAQPNGAESDYYQAFGYDAKNGPFESVEELLLVRGVTPQVLFGYDLNRDGVIDDAERNAGGGIATSLNGAASDTRGLFNFVTVHSSEPDVDSSGGTRHSVNAADRKDLQDYLTKTLTKPVADKIIAKMPPLQAPSSGKPPKNTARPKRYSSVIGFLVETEVPKDAIAKIIDHLTVNRKKTPPKQMLINVATAPRQVLKTLPTLEDKDVDTLISQRDGAHTTDLAWVLTAITDSKKATGIGPYITSRSFQYSADIVAVSGDGRSFKRARIVVDASGLVAKPAKPATIIYRKDLTSAGWPLDPDIRNTLRSGNPLVPLSGSVSGLK